MLFVLLLIRIPLSKFYEEKLKLLLKQRTELNNIIENYRIQLREYCGNCITQKTDDKWECCNPPKEQTKIVNSNRIAQKLEEKRNSLMIIRDEINIVRNKIAEVRLNEIIPKIDNCECDDEIIKKLKEKISEHKINEL